MCDTVTAIAFRHSREQVEFVINRSKFMEYSKNWRQCIYIDKDNGNFVASRQYPREDETISKAVRTMLEEKISEHFNIENRWKTNRENCFIKKYMRDYCYGADDDWDDDDGDRALHYNDIWHGYHGIMVYNSTNDSLQDTDIPVGSAPICPICGERVIDHHNRPACYNCYAEHLD